MAVTAVRIAPPETTAGGRRLAGYRGLKIIGRTGRRGSRHCVVFAVTVGTAGTIDTKLRRVESVIILQADGVTVDPNATATIGGVTTGTYTSTIAALTGGNPNYIIFIGLPPGR